MCQMGLLMVYRSDYFEVIQLFPIGQKIALLEPTFHLFLPFWLIYQNREGLISDYILGGRHHSEITKRRAYCQISWASRLDRNIWARIYVADPQYCGRPFISAGHPSGDERQRENTIKEISTILDSGGHPSQTGASKCWNRHKDTADLPNLTSRTNTKKQVFPIGRNRIRQQIFSLSLSIGGPNA